MRNSLLVESPCAENVTGLKHTTEDMAAYRKVRGVGEHSHLLRSRIVRFGGAMGRENVGMSNRKKGERPFRRKPKLSLARTISQGLGVPNRRPERIGGMDSQLIFWPLVCVRWRDGD